MRCDRFRKSFGDLFSLGACWQLSLWSIWRHLDPFDLSQAAIVLFCRFGRLGDNLLTFLSYSIIFMTF